MTKVLRPGHSIKNTLRNIIPLFLFLYLTSNTLAQNNPDTVIITQEKTIYDTVFIQDTIVIKDTIFEANRFYKSIAISAGGSFPSIQWGGLDNDLSTINSEASSYKFSYFAGLDFKLDADKWSFSTGISYSKVSQEFSLNEKLSQTDSSLYYVYDSTSFWQLDTIDTYYQQAGDDTITIYITDSTEIWNIDSTENYTIFTTSTDTTYLSINGMHCLQIPVIVHKPVWISKNHVFYVQAGILGNIIFKENILYMSSNGLKEIHNQSIQFRPQALIGISWEQYIGDYWSLELHSNYWFSPLPKQPACSSWDIRFAIRYYL